MIINVFSDTHLITLFNKKKHDKILHIIETCDKVIINGDFWDAFRISFDKFLKSKWKRLFKPLKEKDCVYIFGNHDPESFSDERVAEFCNVATHSYEMEFNGHKYVFQHGHNISLCPDISLPFIDKTKVQHFIYHIFYLSQFILYKLTKTFYYLILGFKPEKQMRKWQKNNLDEKTVLITSHTHYGRLDIKNKFVNTGMNYLGTFQYIQLDTSKVFPDNISLKAI
ncbi:metallophosphoesterase family protein [Patescibacteria group bacterium]|nr:metallophosphoesterase family protein [Patescibacteria group bacterium]